MNYYERIQCAVDYIENHITEEIDTAKLGMEAFMSRSNFYRMFFSITGYTVKEYIRLRRLSQAAAEIRAGQGKIIDIALKYGFESPDSFTRAFKKAVGCIPAEYKITDTVFCFEPLNIPDKYFDEKGSAFMEKYPDIKVLKEVPPMRTACYNYFGKEPENNAFAFMSRWIEENNINLQKARIFGYNNPSPAEGQEEYGYEVCITVDDDIQINDEQVEEKILTGGKYAVINVSTKGEEDYGHAIVAAWQRLNLWIKESKYNMGRHQWMEEHLNVDQNCVPESVDIYMPIKK